MTRECSGRLGTIRYGAASLGHAFGSSSFQGSRRCAFDLPAGRGVFARPSRIPGFSTPPSYPLFRSLLEKKKILFLFLVLVLVCIFPTRHFTSHLISLMYFISLISFPLLFTRSVGRLKQSISPSVSQYSIPPLEVVPITRSAEKGVRWFAGLCVWYTHGVVLVSLFLCTVIGWVVG